MAKLNIGIKLNPSKTAVVLIAGVTISGTQRAPSTSLYHLVPKHLRATWPRPVTWHKKPSKTCCCPHCRCHHLGYSVLPAHHCTIWCRMSPSGHVAQALTWHKKPESKLLLSSLPVSPSRVLRAPSSITVPSWCRSTFGPQWPIAWL